MNNNRFNDIETKKQIKQATNSILLKGTGVGAAMIGFVIIQYVFIAVICFIASKILPVGQYNQFLNEFASHWLVLLFAPIIFTLPPFLVFALISKTKISASYKKPTPSFDVGLALYFAGIGASILANYLAAFVQMLFNSFGVDAQAPEVTIPDNIGGVILLFIGLAVMPSIIEEFACRVVILNSMRRYGDWVAIICSAAIFGLLHGNLVQIPFAFVCGVIFAYITVKTDSVWISMALHFTNNIVSCVSYLLMDKYNEYAASAVVFIYNSISLFLGIAAIFYLIFAKHYSFKLFSPVQAPIGKGRAIAAFLLSPGMIIAELVFIIIAIASVMVV